MQLVFSIILLLAGLVSAGSLISRPLLEPNSSPLVYNGVGRHSGRYEDSSLYFPISSGELGSALPEGINDAFFENLNREKYETDDTEISQDEEKWAQTDEFSNTQKSHSVQKREVGLVSNPPDINAYINPGNTDIETFRTVLRLLKPIHYANYTENLLEPPMKLEDIKSKVKDQKQRAEKLTIKFTKIKNKLYKMKTNLKSIKRTTTDTLRDLKKTIINLFYDHDDKIKNIPGYNNRWWYGGVASKLMQHALTNETTISRMDQVYKIVAENPKVFAPEVTNAIHIKAMVVNGCENINSIANNIKESIKNTNFSGTNTTAIDFKETFGLLKKNLARTLGKAADLNPYNISNSELKDVYIGISKTIVVYERLVEMFKELIGKDISNLILLLNKGTASDIEEKAPAFIDKEIALADKLINFFNNAIDNNEHLLLEIEKVSNEISSEPIEYYNYTIPINSAIQKKAENYEEEALRYYGAIQDLEPSDDEDYDNLEKINEEAAAAEKATEKLNLDDILNTNATTSEENANSTKPLGPDDILNNNATSSEEAEEALNKQSETILPNPSNGTAVKSVPKPTEENVESIPANLTNSILESTPPRPSPPPEHSQPKPASPTESIPAKAVNPPPKPVSLPNPPPPEPAPARPSPPPEPTQAKPADNAPKLPLPKPASPPETTPAKAASPPESNPPKPVDNIPAETTPTTTRPKPVSVTQTAAKKKPDNSTVKPDATTPKATNSAISTISATAKYGLIVLAVGYVAVNEIILKPFW